MLSMTCHACDETMTAETEDDLVDLGVAHGPPIGRPRCPLSRERMAR